MVKSEYKPQIIFVLIFMNLMILLDWGFTTDFNPKIEHGLLIEDLNYSYQWEIETIVIDNNWSDTVITYDWCNGFGNESEPYVIENIKFSTGYPRYSIIIKNASESFEIRNSLFLDCNKGIKLENVSNGRIYNNTFSELYAASIELNKCHDINITDNLLYDGQFEHIIINSSYSINVSRNTIDTFGGTNYGIKFHCVNYSRIEHNSVAFTGGTDKLALFHSHHNIVINNSLTNSGSSGLLVYESNFNQVLNNSIEEGYDGIKLHTSHHNEVIYNYITTRANGILVQSFSENNSIISNTLHETSIRLNYCRLNNVSFNYIINPYTGISMTYTNESLILNNTIYHYKNKCMYEYNCVNNTILGNICIPLPIPPDFRLSIFLIVFSIVAMVIVVRVIQVKLRRKN